MVYEATATTMIPYFQIVTKGKDSGFLDYSDSVINNEGEDRWDISFSLFTNYDNELKATPITAISC